MILNSTPFFLHSSSLLLLAISNPTVSRINIFDLPLPLPLDWHLPSSRIQAFLAQSRESQTSKGRLSRIQELPRLPQRQQSLKKLSPYHTACVTFQNIKAHRSYISDTLAQTDLLRCLQLFTEQCSVKEYIVITHQAPK